MEFVCANVSTYMIQTVWWVLKGFMDKRFEKQAGFVQAKLQQEHVVSGGSKGFRSRKVWSRWTERLAKQEGQKGGPVLRSVQRAVLMPSLLK